jgi:hypothetical protein
MGSGEESERPSPPATLAQRDPFPEGNRLTLEEEALAREWRMVSTYHDPVTRSDNTAHGPGGERALAAGAAAGLDAKGGTTHHSNQAGLSH